MIRTEPDFLYQDVALYGSVERLERGGMTRNLRYWTHEFFGSKGSKGGRGNA